jgi:hypothetical protein
MINLSKLSSSNFPSKSGRKEKLAPMSVQQARLKAESAMASGLPDCLEDAVNLLTSGGVMSAAQLGYRSRSLRRYRELRIVDRLPFNVNETVPKHQEYGLPLTDKKTDTHLFILGPVGIEIAKIRHEITPSDGYMGYSIDRLMHDVIVNELVLRIAAQAMAHGWEPIWVGEKEAILYKEKQPLVRPDSLIRLAKDGQERVYLLEYHNEDKSTRAADKVQTYERVHTSDVWKKGWNTAEFPPILAAYRQPVVGRGYKDAIEERNLVNGTYYGRGLSTLLEDVGEWYNFTQGQAEHVWPWAPDGDDQADVSVPS